MIGTLTTRLRVNWQVAVCLLAFFAQVTFAETVYESEQIAHGVEYLHRWVKEVPWSIHVLRFERNRADLDLVTTLPNGQILGLSPTTEQMKFIPREEGEPIGAINGDFFSWRKGPYQGDPAGLQIMNGELVSAPHLLRKGEHEAQGVVAFWLDPHGKPHMGKVHSQFQVELPGGAKLPIRLNETCEDNEAVLYSHIAGTSTRTTNVVELILERSKNERWLPLQINEDYVANVRAVASTNSPLDTNTLVLAIGEKLYAKLSPVRSGMFVKISTTAVPSLRHVNTAIGGWPLLVRNGKAEKLKDPARHPRTAFGWNRTHYFFVVVDGRRAGVSDGMTFAELANEMVWWGCTDAMNLDGGGSAMLWANGKIRNQPSENRERPCANALVLLRKK